MTRGKVYVTGLVVLVVALLFQTMLMHPNRGLEGPGLSGGSSAAPEIALPVQKGKPAIALSSLKGKVVLLDFWATWCGPCRQSIPELVKLYDKYHAQGLEIYGISVDQDPSAIPQLQQSLGINYPIVLASDIPDIREKYVFSGIPQLYVIDKKGQIVAKVEGYDPNHDLDTAIAHYLKE